MNRLQLALGIDLVLAVPFLEVGLLDGEPLLRRLERDRLRDAAAQLPGNAGDAGELSVARRFSVTETRVER